MSIATITAPPLARRPVYLNFAQKSFQRQLAYKFEYFVGILNGLLFIFIFTSLWAAIYDHSPVADAAPLDRSTMITYAVYAMLMRISMTMDDNQIEGKVRSGNISIDLIKPVSFPLMLFADCAGQTFFHWVTRVVPIFFITLFFFDTPPPTDLVNYALAAVAWVLGYLVMFLLNYSVSILSFWFLEVFSFHLMKYGLFTLFAGGILPIDFFPDWLRPIADALPFKYILYVPTSLFIGHIGGTEAIRLIGLQAVWVLLLGIVCHFAWRAGIKKLVVQGG